MQPIGMVCRSWVFTVTDLGKDTKWLTGAVQVMAFRCRSIWMSWTSNCMRPSIGKKGICNWLYAVIQMLLADLLRIEVTSEPPQMAGQADCLQGQDCSAVSYPSSSHARHYRGSGITWRAARQSTHERMRRPRPQTATDDNALSLRPALSGQHSRHFLPRGGIFQNEQRTSISQTYFGVTQGHAAGPTIFLEPA
ncbi:hypothetical protein J6590_029255 [Homalodisca vitripennis]|nr:hypothetical protein J6590_029255 [Homalodisca vitripennis]